MNINIKQNKEIIKTSIGLFYDKMPYNFIFVFE